jgi:deoxyribodipyrimidine photo-lyase
VEAGRLRFAAGARTAGAADYVLVWMQKAQRAWDNPALDLGFHLANALGLPLLVLFVLTDYPGAQSPHYRFMLAGLRECADELRRRGAAFVLESGEMAATVAGYARNAAVIVADEGKLRFEREWRHQVAAAMGSGSDAPPPMVIVETESVVPPDAASGKLEWSAATIRRRISAQLPFYLREPARAEDAPKAAVAARAADFPSHDELFDADAGLPVSRAKPASRGLQPGGIGAFLRLQRPRLSPGYAAGMARFDAFLEEGLGRYGEARNDPLAKGQSDMSPYLHFGQVSPVSLARLSLERSETAAQPYIEQLAVRRELALNFTLRCPGYDRYETAVPDWARQSLESRAGLSTPYSIAELESGRTEDPYWNAAQKEMILTGKMHNYMRMYWGKRLLSWFADPAEAFRVAIALNDTYSLDGRDPNGYAGVAWCFGRHDRPWPQRAGFGSVRAMMASGLRKKFDVERYASTIEALYTERTKEAP